MLKQTIAFLGLTLSLSAHAEVYLSSYDIESGFSNSWGGIQVNGFHGIRFSVTSDVHVTGLTAYMGGAGSYFGAIVAVEGPEGLPSLIAPSEVASGALAYNTGLFNSESISAPSDHLVALDVTLSAGTYVAFFGGFGSIFDQDWGGIYMAANPSQANIDLNDYVIKSTNSWSEAPFEPVRILIHTDTISQVPLPAAVYLFGSALIGMAGIKRKK
ncbi:VPLPA-CTERM sorting domain-containing protein [Oceanicoccus sp. KOV_DT_Chl]|uniref:VPLPA-CTERM sorting domain-containing protein n=1 Tax=Oceanicoccus sp. KOV_DT_Chl TaxID=1904639 RepID=UPI000C7BF33E|nr:VPLPA-CTERM sorting domain-containing protein [Oceanicoccus sp. KOV_DT_Chl]